MAQGRIVSWTHWVLCSAFLVSAEFSVAWAQAAPEAGVYVDRAVLAYDKKSYDEAVEELREALRLNPQYVDAWYYLGLVYVAMNRPADAQAALEEAQQLRPGDADVAFQIGVLYFNQQEYEKAEPLLRQVYRSEPRRQNLGYYLGFIEYRKENYRAAVDFLRATVPGDDNFAQLTHFYTGLAMSVLGFSQEARTEIEEAIRLQPVSPLTTPAQRFGEVLKKAEERERFFQGELRLGVFYDTNVPVVPATSSDIVGQLLRQEQKRRQSEGELATFDLFYTWLRTLDWEGTLSYRFLQTYNNHLTEFNVQSHTPNIGLAYRSTMSEMPYITQLQLTYDLITLDNSWRHFSRFTQRGIVSPYFTLVENPWNVTTLQFRFQVKDFFNDREVLQDPPVEKSEVRDALNYMVGAVHFFVFEQGRHYIKVGYQYDFDDAEGENWIYHGHRALAGAQYTLPWEDVRLRYDLDFHWRFHNPETAPDTGRRRDREPIHLVSIAKDFFTDFTASVEYLFDKNGSNLKPFDYDRHVVTTSLTWRF